ncbi:futalosine hydrolase [Paenibacillus sp. 1P07SE]|uniref:futalosine hydrolase n=1 Tax=Paenibacillus sp. 1P07SE TaxID=3132209 RepID=UPI0039A5ABCB
MNEPTQSQAQSVRPADEPLHILIVTAVAAERDAVLRGLDSRTGSAVFDVRSIGVGPAAAAAGTAMALAERSYGLVISAGIAGGFTAHAELGELALADRIIAADLGAETPDGFESVDELGFGTSVVECDPAWVDRCRQALDRAGLTVRTGPVLTVSTVTGTADTAALLARRIPGAVAEAMEGYGAAVAAQARSLPVLELRAISNRIGPRDRLAWRIKEALDALADASAVLREVIA